LKKFLISQIHLGLARRKASYHCRSRLAQIANDKVVLIAADVLRELQVVPVADRRFGTILQELSLRFGTNRGRR
jgi:hypothetical protein